MGVNFEWLKGKISPLLDISEELKSINPDVYYETGEWSIVKLIALAYFVDIYTTIISRQPFFDKMRYVELLSGAGLCKIKDTGDIIAGSALIAAKMCRRPFDEYVFVESDAQRAEALENRMRSVAANVRVIRGDCNVVVRDIVVRFEDKDHYLAFVDCEGLDVYWETVYTLLSKPGDLIFNLQSQNVARVVGLAKSGNQSAANNLSRFYGDDRWQDLSGPDELLESYKEKLREDTNRKQVISLPVRGPGSYRYDLILATRRTRGGNPWIRPMEDLSESMSQYGPDFVKMALDILTGRRTTLDSFFRTNEK